MGAKKHLLTAILGLFLTIGTFSVHAAPLELVVETYAVTASTPESVIDALKAQAPQVPNSQNVILGWTQFQWGAVNMAAKDTANGCSITAVDLVGRVVTYHPRLERAATQEWASRFEQFATSVRQHEHKHVQVYTNHWNSLQTELSQQWAGKTQPMACQTARSALEKRLLEWDRSTAADHQQLDAREGHFDANALRNAFGLR